MLPPSHSTLRFPSQTPPIHPPVPKSTGATPLDARRRSTPVYATSSSVSVQSDHRRDTDLNIDRNGKITNHFENPYSAASAGSPAGHPRQDASASNSSANASDATKSATPVSKSAPRPSTTTLGNYQLGDCLGRGAFGSVYRGLNYMNGETVAVKQVQLGNIPKAELGEIMSEIDLLKNLRHPNIVKYKGSEKTKDYLYIILEYCENGSLHHICKRFGKFPEGLVSVYISQVLDGLIYLHDQGVIHRDIKGANILTTKDGSVKLADFGVATKTGTMTENAVVGSPYWMAPEVIDQSGATTASDIWSVGCVVVELLEGKPPYHFLAPMPALFRIVQDDCPPLPESASPVVKDFLLHCFQKDANLRVSARKLLRHPWMVSARKQLEQLKSGGSLRVGGGATLNTPHEEAVKSVQEWNQALKEPPKQAVQRLQDPETVRVPMQPSLRRVNAIAAELGTAKPLARKGRLPSRPTLPIDFSPPSAPRKQTTPAVESTSKPSSKLMSSAPQRSGSSEGNAAQTSNNKQLPSANGSGFRAPLAGAAPVTSLMDHRVKLADLQQPESADDNWDDDFEEDITTTKIAALERTGSSQGKDTSSKTTSTFASNTIEKQEGTFELPPTLSPSSDSQVLPSLTSPRQEGSDADFDMRTIRPMAVPLLRNVASSPSVRESKDSAMNATSVLSSFSNDDADDYSDLVGDEQEDLLNKRIRELQMKNSVGKRLFHPNDLTRLASPGDGGRGSSRISSEVGLGSPSRPSDRRRQASSEALRSSLSASGMRPSSNPTSPHATLRLEKDEKWKQMRRTLGKYSEDHYKEDYSDLFGQADDGSHGKEDSAFSSGNTLQLTARLSNRSWMRDDDGDEDDPFAEIDEGLNAEADLEANVARDQHARMCAFVTELVESLDTHAGVEELLQVCEDIDQVLTDMPEMKAQLLASHGALALIQLLEAAADRELAIRLLGILNLIIFEDPEAQENLCLIGAIPVVMTFTTKKWTHDLRLEAAHFVFAMCSTSRLTLQFVLSCRGLRTLVNLIDEDYLEQKDLVWIGVGCVSSVLELQSPASRNDFCRMLAQEGLLEPLSSALQSVIDDEDDEYASEARANILHIFLIYSQSDNFLKKQVATRSVLRRVLRSASTLDPESLTLILKIVKNLSMSPTILDEMQNANTIEILTNILEKHHSGPHGTETSNQVLNTMYNLCRLSKSRQEEAAQAGIIPQLLRVARTNSPLRQFALPILCDFAHAGKATRKMFWQHRGLHFYLKLLEDPYWQVSALESILVWLQDETARVEEVLLQSTSIESLLCVFATSKANSFENLLEPFVKMCRLSSGIVAAMARNTLFVKRLLERLSHPKAVVRLNVLRITKMICDLKDEARSPLVEQLNVYDTVEKLSIKDNAVLVKELARDLLSQRQLERGSARNVRRTLSDTHVGEAVRTPGSAGSNSPSSIPPPLPHAALGQLVGMRASAPYRRKISNGAGSDASDMSSGSVAHSIIHERSMSSSRMSSSSSSSSGSSKASTPSAARSAAMRNLVGRLGQPRRSTTPNCELMSSSPASFPSSHTSPLMPMEPTPQGETVRHRQNSQPQVGSERSRVDDFYETMSTSRHRVEEKTGTAPPNQFGLHRGMSSRTRSISNEIKRAAAYANMTSAKETLQRTPSLHASMDASSSRNRREDPEDNGDDAAAMQAVDKDMTMRPPPRRPIPSLPSDHRFSPEAW
ncbi:related to MAPKK kinase [Melanopsichium pennsylvanicum]|uniref:Related to MAPKK kinase n=2 Tax=Melanopsichium pennsylvanicum TaxID=63383 RepID=A0AAJ5C4X0_9BASI|nr:related to MAPKK kinase [Melanopsichium pennsylvanicum 4]SNX84122.1 related to MAPKK kinase [Melanopsichium pennsylvanicum]